MANKVSKEGGSTKSGGARGVDSTSSNNYAVAGFAIPLPVVQLRRHGYEHQIWTLHPRFHTWHDSRSFHYNLQVNLDCQFLIVCVSILVDSVALAVSKDVEYLRRLHHVLDQFV